LPLQLFLPVFVGHRFAGEPFEHYEWRVARRHGSISIIVSKVFSKGTWQFEVQAIDQDGAQIGPTFDGGHFSTPEEALIGSKPNVWLADTFL
jgi:hypothetical protein